MTENKTDREVAQLYLELASDCFNKAGAAERGDVADALRRMGRCYIGQAVALDPSLNQELSKVS